MGFERSPISATRHTFPHSSIAWRIFRPGHPLYREVQELGLSAKYKAIDDFRLRVKTLSSLGPHLLPHPPLIAAVTGGYGQIEPTSEDDEQDCVSYFEATYIGRLIHVGRRRPLSAHHIWNAGGRMTLRPPPTHTHTARPGE